MAQVQCAALQSRPTECLDFTSVTRDAFQPLVPPFEAAFQAPRAAWRLAGKPRTARRCSVYQHGPLPPPEDRLLFMLAYVKTYALQVVQGRLVGRGQSQANQWMHELVPPLLAALRARGAAPARSLTALAQRLGVSEADAVTGVAPRAAAPAPRGAVSVAAPASPLAPMTGRNGGSAAPKPLLHSKRVIAGRKETTPSKRACGSMLAFSSSFAVTRMAAAPMSSPWPMPHRIPERRGAGSCRRWGSWRSRSLGGDPHADQATPRPGVDAGATPGEPDAPPAAAADRAGQQ